jgi:hypothetical protein
VSDTYIPAASRHSIIERAQFQREFCQISAQVALFPHEIAHIIPEKHGGQTDANNLAYTCWRCNRHKGSDLGPLILSPENSPFCFIPDNSYDWITFSGINWK